MSYQDEEVKIDGGFEEEEEVDAELDTELDDPIEDELLTDDDELSDEEEEEGFADLNGNEY